MATSEKKAVARRGWLLWLHRIGYVTTALVVAELIGIGFSVTHRRLQDRQMRAARIEDTRTHEGPLHAGSSGIVFGSAAGLLGQLPPLRNLHGDGLRFVAMPSFNRSHFAVAIFMPSADAPEAEGVLARFDAQSGYAPLGQRQFHIPASAYRSLLSKLDQLTDGWPGEANWCLDGTSTAFERVRGRRVTSGVGGCGGHYEQVGRLMWNYLRRFAPGDDLPTREDWEPGED